MQIKTNLEGEHNGIGFILQDGLLHIFGTTYTKQDIKTLNEISYLLTAQGHPIKEKNKRVKYMPSFMGKMSGEVGEYYEDEEEEFNR